MTSWKSGCAVSTQPLLYQWLFLCSTWGYSLRTTTTGERRHWFIDSYYRLMFKQPFDLQWLTNDIYRTFIFRYFWKRSDIAQTTSKGHEVTLGLLRQLKLVDLRVMALTTYARFVDRKIVALYCKKSRWDYKPSLVIWSHATSLQLFFFQDASFDKHITIGIVVVN